MTFEQNIATKNKLISPFSLKKIKPNVWLEFECDKGSPWVAELLHELNEHSTELDEATNFEQSTLNIAINLKKSSHISWEEQLLCQIYIDACYNTRCIKTAETFQEKLEIEVKACLVPQEMNQKEELADQIEVFTEGEIYQLYFFDEQGKIDIKEICHEHIYLNINQYPTKIQE